VTDGKVRNVTTPPYINSFTRIFKQTFDNPLLDAFDNCQS